MNAFEIIARQDRKKFNQVRHHFQRECREFGEDFQLVHEEDKNQLSQQEKRPVAAWRNRHFLAALYADTDNQARLSVNRTQLTNEGGWKDGITWDELMEVKRGIGLGDAWMVEVYPPDAETVNVANMRHLFLVGQPAFAWVKKCDMPKRNPMLKGIRKTLAGMCQGKEKA